MRKMSRIRKNTVSILLLCLILTISAFTIADNGNTTVYITRTGSKYHSSGCSYLKKSKIQTTLAQAVSSGYTPCSKCNPPRLDSRTSSRQTSTVKPQNNSITAKPTSKPQSNMITANPTEYLYSISTFVVITSSPEKAITSTPYPSNTTYESIASTDSTHTSPIDALQESTISMIQSSSYPSLIPSQDVLAFSNAAKSINSSGQAEKSSKIPSSFSLIAVGLVAFLAGRFVKKKK